MPSEGFLEEGFVEKHYGGQVSGKRECWNKCDVCGRFIPYRDIETRKAVHRIVTPDSDVSYESFETLCADHTPNSSILGNPSTPPTKN